MTTNNYLYEKGTIFVSPGGSELVPLAPGVDGQQLSADSTAPNGVAWASPGSGNVTGPGSSTSGNFASFGDTSGELISDSGYSADDFALGAGSSTADHLVSFSGTDGAGLADSGIAKASVALGAGSSTSGNLMSFANTDGKTIQDSGLATAIVAKGVAGPVVDNTIPRFDGTGGKQLQASDTTLSDADVMTFPAEGGVVYTAGGTNARKGTVTLSSGLSGDITTTAAVTGAVIALTIVSLGVVTAPQAMLVTITNGSKFTITSADNTDESVINWAIVA